MDNLLEIMRIMRKPPMGKLIVKIGDSQTTTLDEVRDPKARQRVLAAIGELVSYAGGYAVLEDAGLAPPSQVRSNRRETGGEGELTPEQAQFLESLKEQPAPEPPSTSTRLATILNRLDNQPEHQEQVPEEPRSTAEQINVILQDLLLQDDQLRDRRIRLASAVGGGLQIIVDDEVYQRPGQIPDRAVQEIIKTALRKWESTE
ncbi:MAG: hypothetical protein KDE09_07505 [Anaerolineales bacterium]|nr:hypothetical protein [Anaerolineales bacterium]MCB0017620.1 hypothetical protein [Anaerolineales bacterium]MCB8959645.1 hypothetical protein [Ardenticatenales bacterium]